MITDIQAIDGYEAMTPAEIAAAMNAIPLHHRDAPITGGPTNTASVNLLHLLTARFKVLRQDATQTWHGPLVDAAESDAAIDTALGLLFPHLQVKDSVAFCSSSDEAGNMVNGLTAAVGGIVEALGTATTQDVVDAVALLTGGRRFGSVTAEQVSAALTRHAMESWWSARAAVVSEGIYAGTITTQQAAVDAIGGE